MENKPMNYGELGKFYIPEDEEDSETVQNTQSLNNTSQNIQETKLKGGNK